MEDKEKDELEESKSENDEKDKESEKKSEENEEPKEKSLEERFKELEEKYNKLLQEKTTKDREIKHNESYKKYDLSEENVNLLKRYLSDKDDIDDELSSLNKDFPHLFNTNKETNINKSLDVKDYKKYKANDIDERKLGMIGG